MYHQTTLEAAKPTSADNISISYGTAQMVRTVMRFLDLYRFLDRFKERGIPLGYVTESICIMHLRGNSSMNEWSDRCNVNSTMMETVTHGFKISRKTYERALAIMDEYFEDITMYLNTVLHTAYPDLNTDVYVDGSHIERAGTAGENVRYGEGGGTVQLQDQFMVAQLVQSGLPVMVELYPGNYNDPQQFSDFIPQLMFLLKQGSTIIMDNGGSSKQILDDIRTQGFEYITRLGLNQSDERIIRERISEAEYVGYGVACIRSTFDSSERTNYLFFSVDTLISEIMASEREAMKEREEARIAREAIENGDVSDLVSFRKNGYVKMKIVKYELKVTLDPWLDIDFEKEAEKKIAVTGGWFKLGSSRNLNPK